MIHSNALVFLPATRNRPPPKLCLSLLKPAPKIQFMPPCLHVLPCLLVSLFFLGCASYGVCSLEYSVCRYGMEHGAWNMEYGVWRTTSNSPLVDHLLLLFLHSYWPQSRYSSPFPKPSRCSLQPPSVHIPSLDFPSGVRLP